LLYLLKKFEKDINTSSARAPLTFIAENKQPFGVAWIAAIRIPSTGALHLRVDKEHKTKINFMFHFMTRLYATEIRRIGALSEDGMPIFHGFDERTKLERLYTKVCRTELPIIRACDQLRMSPFYSSFLDSRGRKVCAEQTVDEHGEIRALLKGWAGDPHQYYCFGMDVPQLKQPPLLDILPPLDS